MTDGTDTTTTYRVRRARSLDLNGVVDLYTGCGLVPAARGFRNELERKLISDPDLFLIAVTPDDDIVGAVAGGWDGRTITVSRLATHPAHRRRGVASALVAQMREVLDGMGARDASVIVVDDTIDARGFWAGIGYDHAGRVPVYRPASS